MNLKIFLFVVFGIQAHLYAQTPPPNTTACRILERHRWCWDCSHRTRIRCGERRGFIANRVRAKAVKVKVTYPDGQYETRILSNPPSIISSSAIERWVQSRLRAEQGGTLADRRFSVTVNRNSFEAEVEGDAFFYDNSVAWFGDNRGRELLGSIEQPLPRPGNRPERPASICHWDSEPHIIAYDPTSEGGSPSCGVKMALCRGRVTCRNRTAPAGRALVAVCKALSGGRRCPDASACANDSEVTEPDS